MVVLIILFPFLNFLSIIFGALLGAQGIQYIVVLGMFSSFFLSSFLLYDIIFFGTVYKLVLIDWIVLDYFNLSWSFCFDSLTVILLFIVTFISLLVHLYSLEYMSHDPHLPRFLAYLSLFTLFMLILVTANNFLQMFVGWEGVGLSSYLLINFWFTRIQANKSAIKAMLVNRVGDFFILLAFFFIYLTCNSLDYDIVFTLISYLAKYKIILCGYELFVVDLIALFLVLGAMGKSAQVGLHTWLPDAMEGPTPVSALIHAATMVTAGVFLIARCSFIFEYSPQILNLIMFVGATTAFFAATTGLFQNDIKKVIAYSTCSQLGYMIFACGLSSYDVGVFHLSNHAFFKALLFLGAGSIIHAVSDEQDMRKLGGLKNLLPFSYSIMLIGSLALIGFPFFTGFYSKDIILEIAYAKSTVLAHFCYILGTSAAFFTAFYSTRLLFLIFLSNPNGFRVSILHAHEGSWKLGLPLFLLTFFSIGVGFLSKDLFIGLGTNFWGSAIFVLFNNYMLVDSEFILVLYKLFPLIFTVCGVFFAYILYSCGLSEFYVLKKNSYFLAVYTFFSRKWYFDRFYNQFVTQNLLAFGYNVTYQIIDRGVIELFGPFGVSNSISSFSKSMKFIQSGNVFHYLFFFLLALSCTVAAVV